MTAKKPKADAKEIGKALDLLFEPDAVIELRAIQKWRKRIDAGYFDGDHRATLVSEAVKLNQEDAAVYVTLNPVDPQLLSRYNNRIQENASATATDANVVKRRWLLVDIDPVRPKDTAATDKQLERAKKKGHEIFTHLKGCGWPDPVVAESGNGLHLLYRVDMLNDDQSKNLVKGILNTLAEQFDDNTISIDRSVFNAARIIKLHGTVATKGDHTATEAPWRLSKITTVPETIFTISQDKLRALIPVQSPETPRQRLVTNSSFNLEEFLVRLAIPYQMDMHDGRERYQLEHCPFNQDHGKNESAIFRDENGVLGFNCFHNGCTDKSWQDVRTLVDGPVEDRRRVEPNPTVKGEEWEPTNPDWPIMDPRAYHGITAGFIELASRNSEADPAAILATFLVRFGVEIGPGAFMQVGDSKHRARLASVIVGASSKSRKGTSSKAVKKLFDFKALQQEDQHFDVRPTARVSKGPFSSGEGIIFALRDVDYKWNIKENKEDISDPGVADKRLFVMDEEFGGVLANTKREGNTLSMIIRQAWDSGNFDPLTKNNKTTATGGHVGWVSHITLTELHSKLNESEGFNGFANRILWVCAKRQKLVPIPKPMPPGELLVIQRRLMDILFHVRQETEVKLGKEAETAWQYHYYADLTRDRPGLCGCVTNRGEAQALRLAMIYCLLDGHTVITIDHLEAGIAFWNYCSQSANYIFHGRQRDMTAQMILEGAKKGPMTATEIYGLFGNNISKAKLETALSELTASGQVVSEKLDNPKGRPTLVFYFSEKPN